MRARGQRHCGTRRNADCQACKRGRQNQRILRMCHALAVSFKMLYHEVDRGGGIVAARNRKKSRAGKAMLPEVTSIAHMRIISRDFTCFHRPTHRPISGGRYAEDHGTAAQVPCWCRAIWPSHRFGPRPSPQPEPASAVQVFGAIQRSLASWIGRQV